MRSYNHWPRALRESVVAESSRKQPADPTWQLYKQLDREKKEIRLLVVEPGIKWGPVKAKFRQVFLTDDPKPEYETISYVWGDPSQRSIIHLHGRSISVPSSSEVALRRMRHYRKVRVLWIDAICINQDDDRERGHQVAIMADIYGSTRRNLIWLGEDDQYTAAALHSITGLNEEFRRETDDLTNVEDTLYTSRGGHKYSSQQVLAQMEPQALNEFYQRPWFSRLWVVQEAALAPRSECFCGRHQMALELVLRAAKWLKYKVPSRHGVNVSSFERVSLMFDHADHTFGLFAGGRSSVRPAMIDLLQHLRFFRAREPRDHVFALLGLWHKHHPDETLPASLEPHYSSPLSTILWRATQFAIEEAGNLAALKHVSHRIGEDEILGLPTWVPRWHEAFDYNVDTYTIDTGNEWPRAFDVLMNFEGDGLLCVNGNVLDHVQQPPLPVPRWLTSSDVLEYWYKVESTLARRFGISEAGRDDLLSEFAKIGKPQLKNQQTVLYSDWRLFVIKRGSRCMPGENCERTEKLENVALVQNGLSIISHNRRFFVTPSRYCGFGPPTMREGDVLAILRGLRVPAILRPCKSYPGDYEFVGLAVVHGIMDGEAIFNMWDGWKEWSRIRLR